jgi:Dockerin type I domain
MLARLGVQCQSWLVLFWFVALSGSWQSQAIADPPDILRNYRFITDKSIVEVTGGFAGVDWPLNILGRFGLVTGYNYGTGGPTAHAPTLEPFAQFTDVKAILFDPRRATPLPSPGWDLDKTLNLSGLSGTFTLGAPDDLFFLGADGQGQAIRLEASVTGRLLHLTGGSSDPLCCDFYRYRVDAWAHQLPWADFNADGNIDAADYAIWQQHFGSSVAAGVDGDANGDGMVDATDYTVWRDQLGESDAALGGSVVPEPSALALLIIGASARFWARYTLRLNLPLARQC